MMPHIVAHSRQVCRVAVVLTDALNDRGIGLHRDLVRAAAMLHDITKTRSFESGEDHAETGGRLLTDLGWPEVGDIVRQHVHLDANGHPGPPTEVEIVNYADKRVMHDSIVSLEQRMDYILQRYGTTPMHRRRIQKLWQQTTTLEQKLFDGLPFEPAAVASRL